jgi:hypothetical protein
MSFLRNRLFDSRPVVVHGQGDAVANPMWPLILERCFAQPPRELGPVSGLTILTWNNGHPSLGVMERSLAHLGVPCLVLGAGLSDWINSRDKPRLTRDALLAIDTPYVMGVDSRDAVFVDAPACALERFERSFACDLLFNAQKINWPQERRFRTFEESRPGARESEFRFLNGGAWIGRTAFCRGFFDEASRTPPLPDQPGSEQGILKQLFMNYHPAVQLDYQCRIFQTLEYVLTPMFDFGPEPANVE